MQSVRKYGFSGSRALVWKMIHGGYLNRIFLKIEIQIRILTSDLVPTIKKNVSTPRLAIVCAFNVICEGA